MILMLLSGSMTRYVPEGNEFFRLKSAVGTAGYLKNAPKSILFPEMFLQTFRVASRDELRGHFARRAAFLIALREKTHRSS